jgi:hypothetical protein
MLNVVSAQTKTELSPIPTHDQVLLEATYRYGFDQDTLFEQFDSWDAYSQEVFVCGLSKNYFVQTYCKIQDSVRRDWIPFRLWPTQAEVLDVLDRNQLCLGLKARQVGFSWLVIADAIHEILFRPIAQVLIFSRRDDEAVHLLDDRLKGMYWRLPRWLQAKKIIESNTHQFTLSNESTVRAFPTTGGDTYTATYAIIDEADFIADFDKLLVSVRPTIEMGGRLVILGRPDKRKPNSGFKMLYKAEAEAAKEGKHKFATVFIPWHAHPLRTEAWYRELAESIKARTGALDELHEMYPETPEQALSAKSADKRIPAEWIDACYERLGKIVQEPGADYMLPTIPSLRVYFLPEPGVKYIIGADPAEGNPTSDDSAATVLRKDTLEEVASLRGKFQPSAFAQYLATLSDYFNNAQVMVERNNHGHAVILVLEQSIFARLLPGRDGKPGWLTNSATKPLAWSLAADVFRDRMCKIHTQATMSQIAAIEGSSLSAPSGDHDDLAYSFVLALCHTLVLGATPSTEVW